MRSHILNAVYEFAKQDERVVFIGSDLGAGTLDQFRDEFPDRFFMEGVSEANIVGMAAGLAAEGHEVWVNTIAPFFVRRAYEQIALDLCLLKRNVRLIASGGGLVYAPLGPTHLAIEDLALMTALPNMAVVAPADAPEMLRIARGIRQHEGPVYIRLGKGNEPDVTTGPEVMPVGQAVCVHQGDSVLIVTTGVTLHTALAAVEHAAARGINPSILHFPTVKPLDFAALEAALHNVRGLVVVEEHVRAGGLGAAIAHWISERDDMRQLRYRWIGLPDAFPDHYGTQAELLAHYGITPAAIMGAAEGLS